MSEQKAVPEIPEDLRGDYQTMQMRSERDVIFAKPRVLMELIERIAALTAELAELRATDHTLQTEHTADAEAERAKYEALEKERDDLKK